MKQKYPPREAVQTRHSVDMASDTDETAPTALDRPLFLGREDIDVPHTRERSIASLPDVSSDGAPETSKSAPSPNLAHLHPPLWVVAAVAVVGGLVGAIFGLWVAL